MHKDGIVIPTETMLQYPEKVLEAWDTFNNWWDGGKRSLKRSDMPEEILAAEKLILETPIPGFEGSTGADSYYMRNIQLQLED